MRASLDWGLMDYAAIEGGFSLVEIRPMWGVEVDRIIAHRRDGGFSEHEAALWGSLKAYLELLSTCANRKLPELGDETSAGRIRDLWDAPVDERRYELALAPIAAT